jgi:hypothetical protein
MTKSIQTRVWPDTLEKVRREVERRRAKASYGDPKATSTQVVRDAVDYYLDDHEEEEAYET